MRISPPETDRKTYTFVFSFNDGFAPYFSVTLLSLIDHKEDGCLYDIIVLHEGISEEIMDMLRRMIPDEVVLRFFNVADYVYEIFGDLAEKVSSNQWDVSTFYDLLVPVIMPDYEKVMYLDSDLAVCEDLAGLFSLSFEGNELIAAKDTLSLVVKTGLKNSFLENQIVFLNREAGIFDFEKYFNAGVLLFHIPSIDIDTYLERVRRALHFSVLPTVDQDVLNYVFLGRTRLLPPRYNLQTSMLNHLRGDRSSDPEAREFLEDAERPVILHYSTQMKPWKTADCPKSDVFWKYARKSPFYGNIRLSYSFSEWKNEISAFNVKRYLLSKVLSKILPGNKRKKYREEFENQLRLYKKIRSGN